MGIYDLDWINKPEEKEPMMTTNPDIEPAVASKPSPLADFLKFDPEKMKADSEENARQKRVTSLIGGLGDVLGSSNSFGNFYLGRMNDKATSGSRLAETLNSQNEDPTTKQGKLYHAYKTSQEGKQMHEQEERSMRLKDPNSKESKAMKMLVKNNPKWGISVTHEMSASDIREMIDPRKMTETQAAANVSFDKERELRRLDNLEKAKMHKDEIAQRNAEAKAKKEAEFNPNKDAFNRLPHEAQEELKVLSSKSAGKRSIANQLTANLTTLDDANLSDDQKLTAARGIIKVLNSSEGQDAVGSEEAKRLAGYLEYRMGNLTDVGPVWGRAPISEFKTQIKAKSAELMDAVTQNDQRIDELYGRPKRPNNNNGRDVVRSETKSNSAFIDSIMPKANASPNFSPRDLETLSDEQLRKLHGQVTGGR